MNRDICDELLVRYAIRKESYSRNDVIQSFCYEQRLFAFEVAKATHNLIVLLVRGP
jgi:hypothetical protein